MKVIVHNVRLTTILLIAVFIMILCWMALPNEARAEGSKDLYKTTDPSDAHRPYLYWQPWSDLMNIPMASTFHIYAMPGETLYFGSSVYHSFDAEDIVITSPSGVKHILDVQLNGAGHIRTIAEEQGGPFGGYTPISLNVNEAEEDAGWWTVQFHSEVDQDGKDLNPGKQLADEQWGVQNSSVAAWDVTVSKDGETTEIPGRMYTKYLALNTGSQDQSAKMYSEVYVLTKDGFQYKVNLNGIVPYGFAMFANNRGFIDATSGNTLNRSVVIDAAKTNHIHANIIVQNPNDEDSETDVTHRLFLNKPAADLPSDYITELPVPEPDGHGFAGHTGTKAVVGEGGTFQFTTERAATFQFIIDVDGDGIYDPSTNSQDVVIESVSLPASAGVTNVMWDGKKKDGTALPKGEYHAKIMIKGGEYHFPMLDVEYAVNGIIIEALTSNPFPAGTDKYTIYYNDTNYIAANGVTINLDGVGAPSPRDASNGVSSATGAHMFSNLYGDEKGIDTWTYFPGPSEIVTFQVVNGPTAAAASVSTDEDEAIEITLGGSDEETDENDLIYSIMADPEYGSVALVGRTVTYSPDPDYYGTDSFQFQVLDEDGILSEAATVTIDIAPINDAPTLNTIALNPNIDNSGESEGTLFSATDASTIEADQLFVELSFTVAGLQDGIHEIIAIAGTDVPLVNGNAGTLSFQGVSYQVSESAGTARVILKHEGLSELQLNTLIDQLLYNNDSPTFTAGERVVSLEYIEDSGQSGGKHVNYLDLAIESKVMIANAAAPDVTVKASIIVEPDKEYSNEDYVITIEKIDVGTVTESVYADVYYRYTGMLDFATYSAPFTLDQEGTIILTVKVIDRYGTEWETDTTLHLDKTKPGNQDAILVESPTIITQSSEPEIAIHPSTDATDTIWIAPPGTTEFVEGLDMTKVAGDSNTIASPAADGEYVVYVVDRAGNVSEPSEGKVIVDRTDPNADVTPPTITLFGEATVTLGVNELYVETGYAAYDHIDGDLTSRVIIYGTLNTKQVGTYTLFYKVEDSSDNITIVERTIVVMPKQAPLETIINAGNGEDIEDKKVEDAIKGAGRNHTDDIVIKVSGTVTTDDPISVSLSKELVEQAQDADLNLIFEIDTTSIEIPLKAIDTSSMGTNSRLELVVEKLDVDHVANQDMVDAVKDIHAAMRIYDGHVYDFKMKMITKDAAGNTIKEEIIDNFTSTEDITIRIYIGDNHLGVAFMTFYYNETTKKWEYIRGRYEQETGTVRLLTDHLSIYSVMSMTKAEKLEELTKLINDPTITVEEIVNILEDDDLDFLEKDKFKDFNPTHKEDVAQDVSDERPNTGYADYSELEEQLNDSVTAIYQLLHSDTVAPLIQLRGNAAITLYRGEPYQELGATAADNMEGDISGRIIVYGHVNSAVIGTYTLRYTIHDIAGNTAEVTRVVNVTEKPSDSDGGTVSDDELPVQLEPITFKDVRGHWAQEAIELLATQRIIDGYPDGSFRPDVGITRAEFAAIVVKGLGIALSEADTGFVDIQPDAWYVPYIATARQAGIVNGVSDAKYEPDRIVSRQEMTAIVIRAYKTVQDIPFFELSQVKKFDDDSRISKWAQADVYTARHLGLIKGRSPSQFVPLSQTLRGEAATLIYRFLDALGKI